MFSDADRPTLKAQVREKVFNVLVERDEDGYYVASVVELPGCHTQARTLDQLSRRIKEAVEGYLQVAEPARGPEFVAVQQLKMRLSSSSKLLA